MFPSPTILSVVPLADFERLAAALEVEQRARVAAEARVRELETDVVSVPTACELTGLGRTALWAESKRRGTHLVKVPNGRAVGFTRASCVAYRRAKELNQHRLAA